MVLRWSGTPGRVIGMPDPSVPGGARFVKMRPDHTFEAQTSIITRVTISQQTNHQFLHTIGGLIFIYVFGDRIGGLVVQGLTFIEDCDKPGGETGPDHVLKYWNENKLTAREEEMEVTVGKTPIRGFMTNMQIDVLDPKTRVSQFMYQMTTVPDQQDSGAGGGGNGGSGPGGGPGIAGNFGPGNSGIGGGNIV